MSNPDHDDDLSILRVIGRKSARGNEVKWTEEAIKRSEKARNGSEETIDGESSEDAAEGRGKPHARYRQLILLGPIAFDLNDPLNPKSWSEGRKWYISVAATVGGICTRRRD